MKKILIAIAALGVVAVIAVALWPQTAQAELIRRTWAISSTSGTGYVNAVTNQYNDRITVNRMVLTCAATGAGSVSTGALSIVDSDGSTLYSTNVVSATNAVILATLSTNLTLWAPSLILGAGATSNTTWQLVITGSR